jgi:imidazolonepropionase-like amidohydrolase
MSDGADGAGGANTYGMDSAGFASDIDAETEAYMANQKSMFTAEMKAQNKMQQQTTEEEFAQKMNDAAWKTASSAASDKIQ